MIATLLLLVYLRVAILHHQYGWIKELGDCLWGLSNYYLKKYLDTDDGINNMLI